MTEDEWFAKGDERLAEWRDAIEAAGYGYLTSNEEGAYELAWEQAGREIGIVE